MILRFLISITFYSMFFLSCRKDNNSEILNNSTDTLVQYFEYTLNDTTYRLHENDTIKFNPSKSTEMHSDDPNNFLYRLTSNIAIEHKMINQSTFKNFNMDFYVKLKHDQMDWEHKTNYNNNYYSPILKQGVFESLFQIGSMKYLAQNCYDSINHSTYAGFIFPFYKINDKSFFSYSPECLNSYDLNKYNQDDSYFKIESAQKYNHKKYGECILLTGEFKVNLYYKPRSSWEDVLLIKNGKFKILVTDNYWRK